MSLKVSTKRRYFDTVMMNSLNFATGCCKVSGKRIAIKMENNDKLYGDDIILTYKDKIVKIPMIGNENYKIKNILIKTRRLR